ncbi:conserved hypothetical protein [Vibrio coralliirubri]|nr:conserved hypothetical protein [Vibrio coralliirubri]
MSWRAEGEEIQNNRIEIQNEKKGTKMCPRMELIETCPNQSAFRAKMDSLYYFQTQAL